jgi:predicted kinase
MLAPMADVTLLCGPACAGKSTRARELEAGGATVLSFDREAWARGVHDGAFTEELMASIDADLHERMVAAVAAGERVVLDASLSTRAVRDIWRMRCDAMGATHELVVVRAPLATLTARLREREPGPESVVLDEDALERFVAGFEWPGDDEPHGELRTA